MKKKIISGVSAAILFFTAAFPVFAKVSFSDLDLNDQDNLIYTVSHEIPGLPSYKTLFKSKLGAEKPEGSAEILTCFPERMELLDNGHRLEVRNRYGTAVYSLQSSSLAWVKSANKIPVEYTHTGPKAVSSDGKYFCYVRQTKSASGQLVLVNALSYEEKVIVENSDFSYSTVPVKWSPTSETLVYEKDGHLFFTTAKETFKNVQLPESYRSIGKGSINCVQWTDSGNILFINEDIIYKIDEKELYTRGLYSSLVGTGKIIGRLPSVFDCNADRFWCSSDGTKIVLISAGNLVNYYSVLMTGYDYVRINGIWPLSIPGGATLDEQIFWRAGASPVLWVDVLKFDSGKKSSSVYTLENGLELKFEVENSLTPALSPDRKLLAFTSGKNLYVYSILDLKLVAKFSGENIISFLWGSDLKIYLGGNYSVKELTLDANSFKSRTLFLSSVDFALWDGQSIVTKNPDENFYYGFNANLKVWEPVSYSQGRRVPVEKNGRFRVFTGNAVNSKFENAMYVRSLSGKVITYPVFEETSEKTKAPKKVALVFDVMDKAHGLTEILNTLNEFGIKSAFFINGEFIRRYPYETRQISAVAYDCGSSFYSIADLTSSSFVIDNDFIKRGLGRNEDEFFAVTGKELSLLWHAPYYHSTELMIDAGKAAGYTYVQAETELLEKSSALRNDTNAYIDSIVNNLSDGMIIPIGVEDADKLDLLIAAILDSNTEIVDLRSLLE